MKKIDLGVSKGPSASELATIRSGNARTKSARRAAVEESISRKSNVGPEQARSISGAMAEPKPAPSQDDQSMLSRRQAVTEIEENTVLPGGRHNATAFEAPHANSSNPRHAAMAKHLGDFISHSQKGNRAGMEAARAGFHALRAENRGTPKGMETPCTGPSCNQTAKNGGTSCEDGNCGGGPVVGSRPRG